MKVYRVVRGEVFGGPSWDAKAETMTSVPTVGTEVHEVFATPHLDCVRAILKWCDDWAHDQNGGASWAQVVVIEATAARAPRPEEKSSHHDDTDRDEQIVSGRIVEVLSWDDSRRL